MVWIYSYIFLFIKKIKETKSNLVFGKKINVKLDFKKYLFFIKLKNIGTNPHHKITSDLGN